jgi:hypothetical protein
MISRLGAIKRTRNEFGMKNLNEKIILTLLVLLALTNLIFFIVSPYSGPIVGFVFAVFASVHWLRKRNAGFAIAIAIIWLAIHIYELMALGASSYPILFYLNLLLPIPLLYCGLKTYLLTKREAK